jgi:hypothetical protein
VLVLCPNLGRTSTFHCRIKSKPAPIPLIVPRSPPAPPTRQVMRSQVVSWEVCPKTDFPRKIDVLSSSYDHFPGRGKLRYIRIYISQFPRILTAVRRRRALTARLPSTPNPIRIAVAFPNPDAVKCLFSKVFHSSH